MIKKIIFSIVFLLLWQSNKAQQVLVTTFEHQSPAVVSFPNYFQPSDWLDSVLVLTKSWLKERLNAQGVDFKKKNPISFSPVFRPTSLVKSLGQTTYDYQMSIVSRLETGKVVKKIANNQGKLTFLIEIYGPNENRVFRGKSEIEFVISENKAFHSEALISETDFQKLYLAGLKTALKIEGKGQKFAFRQPSDESLEKFIQNAEVGSLKMLQRGTYEWKDERLEKIFTIKLGSPSTDQNTYRRTATFLNPFNEKNYEFSANLNGSYPEFVDLESSESKYERQLWKYKANVEEFQVLGKMGIFKLLLTRNEQTNLLKISVDDELIAIFKYQNGNLENDASYEMYLAKSTTLQEKTMIAQILATEILANALIKYHTVEND